MKRLIIVIVAFLLFLPACHTAMAPQTTEAQSSAPSSARPDPGSDLPLHICYQNRIYVYRGNLKYELPEGFTLIGTTINIGNRTKTRDLESNNSGTVYANSNEPDTLIFRWDIWSEKNSGPEPYLLLHPER